MGIKRRGAKSDHTFTLYNVSSSNGRIATGETAQLKVFATTVIVTSMEALVVANISVHPFVTKFAELLYN